MQSSKIMLSQHLHCVSLQHFVFTYMCLWRSQILVVVNVIEYSRNSSYTYNFFLSFYYILLSLLQTVSISINKFNCWLTLKFEVW